MGQIPKAVEELELLLKLNLVLKLFRSFGSIPQVLREAVRWRWLKWQLLPCFFTSASDWSSLDFHQDITTDSSEAGLY